MEIKIGTTLTLESINTERFEKFHCKIVELKNQSIFIDYPINTVTKKTAFLLDGAQFRATITNQKGSFAFKTEVLGRVVKNIPMIILSCPPKEEFIKIQRRQFVRVNTSVDVAVEFNNQYFQFVTDDISAGGLALILKTNVVFEENDIVKLTIVLPFKNREIRYVRMESKVIRIFERNGIKLASLEFSEPDEVDKQYIVRFCFERQLLNRNKELNI
ncbi:flagellar brake protein [Ureibacillus sp. NPDC094379]